MSAAENRRVVVLTPNAVHQKTGYAIQTLANWRNLTNRGQVTGPKSFKFGRLIRYFESDVDAWIASQANASLPAEKMTA